MVSMRCDLLLDRPFFSNNLIWIQQTIPEPAIALIVGDNLDIACSAIEKAAMERAVTDVDEGFAQVYEMRRRHREVCNKPGQ